MTEFNKSYWDEIADQMKSIDQSVRLEAVQTLAEHEDIQAIQLLLKGLQDNDVAVIQAVSWALKSKEHPAVVNGLISLLDSETTHVRACAANILKDLPQDKIYHGIMKMRLEPGMKKSLKVKLIPFMIEMPNEELEAIFDELLQESDPLIQKAAIEGICSSKTPWSQSIRLNLLESADTDIRTKVVNAFKKERSPELIKTLIKFLKVPGVKGQSAVEILSRIADETITAQVISFIDHDDYQVRLNCLNLISRLNSDNCNEIAVNLLKDSHKAVRDKALSILEDRADTSLLKIIREHYPEQSPLFMEAASRLIAIINTESSRELLKKSLESQDLDIRKAVIKGLGSANTRLSIEILKDRFKEKDLQTDIIESIAEAESTDAMSLLLDAMNEASTRTRSHEILVKNSGNLLSGFLDEVLGEEPSDRTIHAINLAGRLGDPKLKGALADISGSTALLEASQRAVAEIDFRSRLQQDGLNTDTLDLEDIERMAEDSGWDSKRSHLPDLLTNSGKLKMLSLKKTELQTECKEREREIRKLGSEVDQTRLYIKQPPSTSSMKFNCLIIMVICVAGMIGCFVMNFQPKPSPYWYPASLAFAAIFGIFAIKMYRLKKVKPPKVSQVIVGDPKTNLEKLEQQYQFETKSLKDAKESVEKVDGELIHLDADDLNSQINELVKRLTDKSE